MASLNKFRRDVAAIRSGEWVEVGIGEETFEIFTRGLTPTFRDGYSRMRREAAEELNRTVKPGQTRYTETTLKPSVDDAVTARAIAEFCDLNVRGLYHDEAKTQPVTADEFREMLRDTETFPALGGLTYAAALRVTDKSAADRTEAVGNSPKPSVSTSFSATSDSV